MTTAIALAQLIIPLLPTIGGDIASLINWINSIRSAARQSSEWTLAMDQAYRQALIAAGEDASWIPDQTPPINEAGALETPEKQVTENKSEIPAPKPAAADAPAPSYRHVVGS